MIKKFLEIRCEINNCSPLVHCLTNHITINDCANVILEVGGKPIMAEHHAEVEEITAVANSLVINLGNITDERMTSMMLSGNVAKIKKIPSIIDVVGVGCSKLRLNFAKKIIEECCPDVIKGNVSEIKALAGISHNARGIDAGEEDIISQDNLSTSVNIAKKLSQKTNAVVVITGKTDIVAQGEKVYLVKNGCEMLSKITGTGCMLNAIIGTFISSRKLFESAVLGAVLIGIAGENASIANGTGSFKTLLHDNIFTITDENIIDKIKLEEYYEKL